MSKSPPKKKRGPKKSYTDRQKQEALEFLRKNDNKITKSAKELGIARKTLESWRDDPKLNNQIEANGDPYLESVKEIGTEVMIESQEADKSYLMEALTARKSFLEKVNTLVEKSNNKEDLHAVVGAFKIIDDSIFRVQNKDQNPFEKEGGNKFFTQINNYIKET